MVAKDIFSRRLHPQDKEHFNSAEYKSKPKRWQYYAALECTPWIDPDTMEILRDPTQEELLVNQRGTQEHQHMRSLIMTNTMCFGQAIFSPQFPPTGAPTGMCGSHALDFCNKTIALYTNIQDPLPIFNYLYRKWLRPYKNPIEFGEFIAKIVQIGSGQRRQACLQPRSSQELQGFVGDIIQLHQQILQDIDAAFESNQIPAYTQEKIDSLENYDYDHLFESLIVLTKELPDGVQDDLSHMQVYLILTGIDNGLSAPITFEELHVKGQVLDLPSNCGPQHNLVLTTLEAAVEFIQGIERREQSVFVIRPDPDIANPEGINMDWLRKAGWTGEDLVGPSHLWVDAARWPNWIGEGAELHNILLADEDPNVTTSRNRLEQKYAAKNFAPSTVPKKRSRGIKKEVEDEEVKKPRGAA